MHRRTVWVDAMKKLAEKQKLLMQQGGTMYAMEMQDF
jgi:hypothetical protein